MSNKHIDLATFEELKRMSGADFIGELIDTFLEEAPKLMGQMRSALRAGDAEAFRRAAHSLKSNAATFGAGQLSGQARELELIGKEGRLKETGDRIGALERSFQDVARELKGLRG
jgi:HPt (histidine-containing phosphotransfer) domain-containing protein